MNFTQVWKNAEVGEFITNGCCFTARIKQVDNISHMHDIMNHFENEGVLNNDSFSVLVYKKWIGECNV